MVTLSLLVVSLWSLCYALIVLILLVTLFPAMCLVCPYHVLFKIGDSYNNNFYGLHPLWSGFCPFFMWQLDFGLGNLACVSNSVGRHLHMLGDGAQLAAMAPPS